MSLFNSFAKNAHLSELADPLDTQAGVLTPAVRRRTLLNNILGNTNMDGTVLTPSFTSAAATDRLLRVPTVASGGVLAAHVTDAMTHSIRIRSDAGTLYYLMATTTVTNRTGGG